MDDRHQCKHRSTCWSSRGYSFHLSFNFSLRFEVFIIKSFEGKIFLMGNRSSHKRLGIHCEEAALKWVFSFFEVGFAKVPVSSISEKLVQIKAM